MTKGGSVRRRAAVAVVVGLVVLVGGAGIALAGGQVVPMISGNCGSTPPRPACWSAWTCVDGEWVHTPSAAGTSCSDGNPCTYADRCDGAGTCAGTTVTCASDQCNTRACNGTSTCTVTPKSNGTTCSDGNACTQTDTCQAGACVGSNPVTCSASDQCHSAGTCNTSTGVCSNPAKANGTTCSDGNACTQTDTCQSGACVGSNPVTCTASDQCHSAGTCNTSTGACSNPAKANGTACSDGNACTQTDTCQGGVCSGSNPVTCTASDQCHDVGSCNTSTGACSNPSKANGTACSDGNLCTYGETCSGGICSGGTAKTCDLNARCGAEACNGTSTCTVTPTAIDDNDPCTADACDPVHGVTHTVIPGCSQAAGGPPIVAPYPDASPPPGMPMAPGLTVDETTGTLNYSYRFDLPKARGRFQPGLGLEYRHGETKDRGYGLSWTIQGLVERGTDLDPRVGYAPGTTTYTREWVTLGGEKGFLVPGPDGRTRLDKGSRLFIEAAAGSAVFLDEVGNEYSFQPAGDPTAPGRLSPDLVSSVVDVFGNRTVYTYQAGEVGDRRLIQIEYDSFTGPWGESFATRVVLDWQAVPAGVVLDLVTESGTPVRRTKSLRSVTVYNHTGENAASYARVKQYRIDYGTRGQRQVVNSITVAGASDAIEENPTAFTYGSEATYSLGPKVPFSVPGVDPASGGGSWEDLDGDGRVDYVWNSGGLLTWARNVTQVGQPGLSFASPQAIPNSWPYTDPIVGTILGEVSARMDFNGDGIPDLVHSHSTTCNPSSSAPGSALDVRFGSRTVGAGGAVTLAFGAPVCIDLGYGTGGPVDEWVIPHGGAWGVFGLGLAERVALLDVTGDGVADYVFAVDATESASRANVPPGWRVFPGYLTPTGGGFGPPIHFGGATDTGKGPSTPTCFAGGQAPRQLGANLTVVADAFNVGGTSIFDFNGDGLPDLAGASGAFPGSWSGNILTRYGFTGTAYVTAPGGVQTQACIQDMFDPNSVELIDCIDDPVGMPGSKPGLEKSRLTGMAIDLDGDGLPDYVSRVPGGGFKAFLNRGVAFQEVFAFQPSGEEFYPHAPSDVSWEYIEAGWCPKLSTQDDPGGRLDLYMYPSRSLPALPGAMQFADLNGDGVLDHVTWDRFGAGAFALGSGGDGVKLKSVTVPTGARFEVTYKTSAAFDASSAKASRFVVDTIKLFDIAAVAGPGATNTTHYWYGSPTLGQPWSANGGHVARGFKQSWVADDGSGVVRATTWATESFVTAGSPLGVTWGAATGSLEGAQPPPYQPFRTHTSQFTVKRVGTSQCLAATDAANPQGSAPYIAVPTLATQERLVNGVSLSSSATQACEDVDDFGNPTRITIAPADDAGTYQILATYDVAATCKNCPVETWTSPDGLKSSALRHSKYFYSDTANGTHALGTVGVGRLRFVSRKANASTWEVPSITTYLLNGNPQTVQTGDFLESGGGVTSTHWMSRTFAYDVFGLRVTNESATDSAGSVTLVTETEYERASGLPRMVTGPYVFGSTAPKAVKTMAYDGLGRPVAVGRGISAIGTGPTTITDAVSAVVYGPTSASPRWAKTYSFGAPLTLTCAEGGSCSGYQASAADVKEGIAYVDGLGRTIQVRERMGGSGTSPGNPANVTQALSSSAYRVSGAVAMDGLGRAQGSLEPFYSTGDGFEPFSSISGSGRRGAFTAFDAQGRVSCSLSGVYAAASSSAAACTQSDADDLNYRTSVRFAYAVGSIIGGAQTMTVTATAGNAVRGTTTSYDAGGRALLVVDPVLSKTVSTYDLLGQRVTVTRKGPYNEMPQTVTTTYDLLGRVTEIADPNWLASGQPASAVTDASGRGRRTLEYFSHGGVKKLTLPAVDVAGAAIRPYVTTTYGSLLRKTAVVTSEPKYVANLGWTFTSRTSTFTYDTPHGPNGGDSVTYPYVAGRMATAVNEVSAIAFGYDQDGTPKERDEWFTPLGSTRYGASIATANDGRAVQAQFTSLGSPTISYSLQYDSFGRPVGVVGSNSGATVLWGTVTTATDGAGAYDALGRIADGRGHVQSNGGTVTTKRTYGAFSGQLLGQETKLGTTDLYRVGSMGYLGEKLTQMTDSGTGTSYAWAYDTGGRLVTATATSNTSSGLTQNYSHSFAFSPVWNLSTANVSWNGMPTSSQGYTYSGADQATQAPGGYQPAYALTHDGMGNIVDRRVPGSPTPAETLTYTAEGYLRSIVRGASTDEVLYYDALGNLAYRRSGTYLWFYAGEHATITATTACTNDPCQPTPGTVKVNVHVLLAGARIATVRTTPGQTADQAFGSVLYFHRDRQGSVVATTTTGGILGAQYRYGPYGELDRYAGNEATAGSDLGYTGGLRLTGGLIHLRARVYDPSYRRFLQADIVDPLRYTYTKGDPTNYVDPSGHLAIYVDGLYSGQNEVTAEQAWASTGSGGGFCIASSMNNRCGDWHRYDQPYFSWAGQYARQVLAALDGMDAARRRGEEPILGETYLAWRPQPMRDRDGNEIRLAFAWVVPVASGLANAGVGYLNGHRGMELLSDFGEGLLLGAIPVFSTLEKGALIWGVASGAANYFHHVIFRERIDVSEIAMSTIGGVAGRGVAAVGFPAATRSDLPALMGAAVLPAGIGVVNAAGVRPPHASNASRNFCPMPP